MRQRARKQLGEHIRRGDRWQGAHGFDEAQYAECADHGAATGHGQLAVEQTEVEQRQGTSLYEHRGVSLAMASLP